MVADLEPGISTSLIQSLTALDNDLFFTALEPTARALYSVDSVSLTVTPVATDVVAPIYQTEIVSDGSRVFFKGRPVAGITPEIWASDGTPAGTLLAADVHPGHAVEPAAA